MENPSRKRIINKTKPTNLLTTPSLLPPPKKKHTTKKEKKQNKNITLLKQKNPPQNTWFFHAMILFYGTIDALNDWMVIEIDCMMKLLKYHGFFCIMFFIPQNAQISIKLLNQNIFIAIVSSLAHAY